MDLMFGVMNNPHLPLKDEVESILSLGFEYVEITVEWPKGTVDESMMRWLSDVSSTGAFFLVHAPWYLEIGHPYEHVRRGALKVAEEILRVADRIESPYVTFHPFTPGWLAAVRDKAREYNLKGFREIVVLSKNYSSLPLVENVDHGAFSSPSDIRYLLDNIPDLGMTFDVAHSFINGGLDKFKSYLRLANRILHIHVHDNDMRRDLHLPVGAGKIPWHEVIGRIRDVGYKGTVTLEPHVSEYIYYRVSKDLFLKYWEESPVDEQGQGYGQSHP